MDNVNFFEERSKGRRGELLMFLRLCNRAYNPPAPGDSEHVITDVSRAHEYQKWGVDFVETWEDIWGKPHELWHEVKTEYAASAKEGYTLRDKVWKEIAEYYYGQPWRRGTGNLFIETKQTGDNPGWFEVIRKISPSDHGADNRIMWFVLPAGYPETKAAKEIPSIVIGVSSDGLISAVNKWIWNESPELFKGETSCGYRIPITEIWKWSDEDKQRAEEMNRESIENINVAGDTVRFIQSPAKLTGIPSCTGSGARLYLLFQDIDLMGKQLNIAESLKIDREKVLQHTTV